MGLITIANLSGFECSTCTNRILDPDSYDVVVEATAGQDAPFGVRAKLSKLARNNIGLYIPQDIQRHLNLRAGDSLHLFPIGSEALVARVEHHQGPTDDIPVVTSQTLTLKDGDRFDGIATEVEDDKGRRFMVIDDSLLSPAAQGEPGTFPTSDLELRFSKQNLERVHLKRRNVQ